MEAQRKTRIAHFDNGEIKFINEQTFIEFVQQLYKENEEIDSPLRELVSYEDCLIYLMLYCSEYTVLYSEVLHDVY